LKLPKTLSAADAFNAEEPIQACDVPGCSALEWDEKAVDELVSLLRHAEYSLNMLTVLPSASFAAAAMALITIMNRLLFLPTQRLSITLILASRISTSTRISTNTNTHTCPS